jgi:cyclopropane fatty-acyl-phospholipid synthase-like methyltransferase
MLCCRGRCVKRDLANHNHRSNRGLRVLPEPRFLWPSMETRSDLPNRSFWQTYTLGNIRNEVRLRLSAFRNRPGPTPDRSNTETSYDEAHAASVQQFYDARHDDFMQVYGEVIQAFRTKDITDLLNYQMRSIGFQPGQHVLDAGCGIAVPAIHFARFAEVHVDAITISRKQSDMALEKIKAANLAGRISVIRGDYHNLRKYFSPQTYDIVYFLESFGHSAAKKRLIEECWEVLKPGGTLYIKDLFRRLPLRPQHQERIEREIRRINQAYRYDVSDLNAVLDGLRAKGFIVTFLKTIDFDVEQFEDLAISNQFQELTGLARIENWSDYVFPVEFFELKCTKPEFSLDERLDRYFLQSRYHRYIEEPQRAAGKSAATPGRASLGAA